MSYSILVSDVCEKNIDKLCKKNSVLREALKKKMDEIIQNPQHYKPLKYDLAGERRVHIMKSFVLKLMKQQKQLYFSSSVIMTRLIKDNRKIYK